jgi:hypothetical protein
MKIKGIIFVGLLITALLAPVILMMSSAMASDPPVRKTTNSNTNPRSQARRLGAATMIMALLAATAGPAFAAEAEPKAPELAWVVDTDGTDFQALGQGVATDRDDNIVVTGYFAGSRTFGSGETNETTLVAGVNTAYVASYTPGGWLRWARSASGSSIGYATAICRNGNAAVVGTYSGQVTFGLGQPNQATLPAVGSPTNAFIASYDSEGMIRWARAITGTSAIVGHDVAVDESGNLTIVGRFIGSATFGAGQPTETTLVSAGTTDAFIASYDAFGQLRWARRAGGINQVFGLGIGSDAQGNTTITGEFSGTATFGPGQPNQTVFTASNTNVFVASYDTDGMLRWARRHSGGAGFGNQGRAVAVDADGNSLVAGVFGGTGTFSGGGNEVTLVSSGIFDAFIVSYDAVGTLRWGRSAGGVDSDDASSIAVDWQGNATITGNYGETFSSLIATEPVTFSGGGYEVTLEIDDGPVYLASYDTEGTLRWARAEGGGTTRMWAAGVALDGAGDPVVTGTFENPTTFGAGEANETYLVANANRDVFVARYQSASERPKESQNAPAAPAVAARLLTAAGIPAHYDRGRDSGNHIADVAARMALDRGTDFNGVPKYQVGPYECAVATFLRSGEAGPPAAVSDAACSISR